MTARVELYEFGKNLYLAQSAIAELFATSKSSVSEHITNILKDGELSEYSVVRNFRTTAKDGKSYNTKFYSLEMILAIGFRVRSKRRVQFRIWANEHLKSYLQKGFLIDSQRLKIQMAGQIILMSYWSKSAIFVQVKKDFIKRCGICLL